MTAKRIIFLLCILLDSVSAKQGLKCSDILTRFHYDDETLRTYQIALTRDPYHSYFDVRAALFRRRGILHMYLLTRNERGEHTTPFSGSDALHEIVAHFGLPNIQAVVGSWGWGTNFETFNHLVARGLSPEIAALRTWSGKKISNLGLTEVEITKRFWLSARPGKSAGWSTTVLFSRPRSKIYWKDLNPEERSGLDWFHE